MDSDIEQKLKDTVEGTNKTLEWAKELYEEKLDDLLGRSSDLITEEDVQDHALFLVNSEVVENDRTGGGGDKVEILSIGHAGVRKWNDGDGGKKKVVISYGIINPEQGPPGVAVFINDETTGVDIGEIMNKFQPLETMVGWYRVNESQNLSNVYVCNSTDKTRLELEDVDGIPDDKKDRRELIHKLSDKAELAHIHDAISITNDQGYPVDFGADLKRFRGAVMNRYVNEEKGFGIYKVMDKSVVDESDLEGLDVMGENDRIPGLSVWCSPEKMKYGQNSEVEIYGQIRVTSGGSNEGQIVMDAYGIVPLIEMPIQEKSSGGSSSGSSDNVEETTI